MKTRECWACAEGAKLESACRDLTKERADLLAEVVRLENELECALEMATAAKKERDRLLVLATKHCDKAHHDWQEILLIAGDA